MPHPKARILIVDDDPVLLTAISDTVGIRLKSVIVDAVESPTAALRHIDQVYYDVVITDVRMPEMDGRELFNRIRKIRPDVPVILMSGHIDPPDMNAPSPYSILKKPLDRAEFIDTVKTAIEQPRLRGKLSVMQELRSRYRDVKTRHKKTTAEHGPLIVVKRQQAVIATDPDGTVIYWSRSAGDLYGWTADEAIGRNIVHLTPSQQSIEQAQHIMDQLRKGKSWSGQFAVQKKDGGQFVAFVNDYPLHNRDGELVGIVGVSSEVKEVTV